MARGEGCLHRRPATRCTGLPLLSAQCSVLSAPSAPVTAHLPRQAVLRAAPAQRESTVAHAFSFFSFFFCCSLSLRFTQQSVAHSPTRTQDEELKLPAMRLNLHHSNYGVLR